MVKECIRCWVALEFRRDICFPRNRFLSESQGSVVRDTGGGACTCRPVAAHSTLLLPALLPVCRQLLQHPVKFSLAFCSALSDFLCVFMGFSLLSVSLVLTPAPLLPLSIFEWVLKTKQKQQKPKLKTKATVQMSVILSSIMMRVPQVPTECQGGCSVQGGLSAIHELLKMFPCSL